MRDILSKLNELKAVPFEQWPSRGIKLGAVSANADGIVNSGILKGRGVKGVYFYRKWSKGFETSEFVLG